MTLREAINHCLQQAEKDYGDRAPMVLFYAAASQTLDVEFFYAAMDLDRSRTALTDTDPTDPHGFDTELT